MLGLSKEFISAPRLDDKLCSFSALWALINASSSTHEGKEKKGKSGGVKIVALFDNEEIGSGLRQGAQGNFLQSVIERVVEAQVGVSSHKKTPCTRVSLIFPFHM